MDTLRTSAQREASRRNGVRSRGPASARGKERSSSNRAGHGLTGQGLVLPGESINAYRRNQVNWFDALAPGTGAEAQIVGQLADLAWRLDRCARLEHKHHVAAVEEEMKKEMIWQNFSLAHRAVQPINILVRYLDVVAQSNPFTGTWKELESLIGAASSTVGIARDVAEIPPVWIDELATAINEMKEAAKSGNATPLHAASVREKAQRVQSGLVDLLQRGDEALTKLRETIAANVAVPPDADLRKVFRYRTEIEKSQARLLGILQQLREQVKIASAARDDQNALPVRFRLRVVR